MLYCSYCLKYFEFKSLDVGDLLITVHNVEKLHCSKTNMILN